MATVMRDVVLGIEGMTCTSCSGTVEAALRSIQGVESAVVNLSTNTADVRFGEPANAKLIICEVEAVGFGAEILQESSTNTGSTKNIWSAVLGIDGMTCTSCSGTVENTIRSMQGVDSTSVVVSLSTNSATFMFDSTKVTINALVDEIEMVGFGADVLECSVVDNPAHDERNAKQISLLRTGSMKATEETGAIKTVLLVLDLPRLDGTRTRSISSGGASDAASAHGLIRSSSDEEMAQPVASLDEASLQLLCERLLRLDGVRAAELRSEECQVKLTYDDFLTGPRDFVTVGCDLGYACTISSMGGFMMANRLLKSQTAETNKLYAQLLLSAALTVPIFCITMVLPMIPAMRRVLMMEIFPGLAVNGALLLLLSFPVQFYVGHQFHSKAWKTLKARALGMDFLVSTGTLAAYLYSTFGLVMGIAEGIPNMHDVEYYETSAVLITAVLLGKYLEVYARGQTAAAIHKLSKLKAHTARLVRSGTAQTGDSSSTEDATSEEDQVIDASLLHRRDIVRLVAGESVPADGQLLPGSHIGVDEAMMTGESTVVSKTDKDAVFGGTIVMEGSAMMRVTACGDDSTLGRIISTVQQAQASKPPIQELADRVARYFVPAIALISFVTFTAWMLAYAAGAVPREWYRSAGNPFLFAFLFALAVWVSACPCAFGLATPTAVLVSTGVAAKHGILIRKGAALQHASDVNVVAFDKTGTLTKGSTEVTDFQFCPDGGDVFSALEVEPAQRNVAPTVSSVRLTEAKYLLQLMLYAECRSSHPLAKGITAYCRDSLVALSEHSIGESGHLPSEEDLLFDVVPGLGIHMYTTDTGSGGGLHVLLGSGKLLESFHVAVPSTAAQLASSYRSGGKVAVYLAVNGRLRAILGVSDAVRPEAAFVVRSLQSRGVACYMITGDERATALAIGRAVGIPPQRILARAKPEDKKGFIEALQRSHVQEGHPGRSRPASSQSPLKVAFVGDGTNDSPALAVADVGFTMASGSDIAVEAGDMVLCKNDLHALLVALDLSQQTMTRIHMNYFWALAYNACLIPIAAGALYPAYHFALAPMLAGAAMALSSVSIVLSSLLLVRYQPPRSMDETPGLSTTSAMGAQHETCNCPASSALEVVVEEPSLLQKVWTVLSGARSAAPSDTMAGLLTPAEWRAATLGSEGDDRTIRVGGANGKIDDDRMEEEGDFEDDGKGKQGVWNPMRILGMGLPSGPRRGGRSGYALVDVSMRDSDTEDDIELARVDAAGKGVGNKKGAQPSGGGGCGCGQGNCRCGSECRCGEARVRRVRR